MLHRVVWPAPGGVQPNAFISSKIASAKPVSRKAPMIGPNSVPMPPMMGARMSSIEREM